MFYFSCNRCKQARTNWSRCRVSAIRNIWLQCTISVCCYFPCCGIHKFKYEEAFNSFSQNSAGQVQRSRKIRPCKKTLAIALVQKQFIEIQSPVNYRDLEREKIIILKDLREWLKTEEIKKHEVFRSSSPSSDSTASVDCTDSSLSEEEQ